MKNITEKGFVEMNEEEMVSIDGGCRIIYVTQYGQLSLVYVACC